MAHYSYIWTALGLLYYVLFQLVYLARFGALNMTFNPLDLNLVVLGVVSVAAHIYFANKLGGWKILLIPYLLALPFSAFGALVGGLTGTLGMLFFGLIPFAITLPIGYWLIKKFSRVSSPISNA